MYITERNSVNVKNLLKLQKKFGLVYDENNFSKNCATCVYSLIEKNYCISNKLFITLSQQGVKSLKLGLHTTTVAMYFGKASARMA